MHYKGILIMSIRSSKKIRITMSKVLAKDSLILEKETYNVKVVNSPDINNSQLKRDLINRRHSVNTIVL